jgi:amidohydrolase
VDHDELKTLARLRRRLHAAAELSGREERTAALVADELAACRPARLLTGVGGHGVAAVFGAEGAAGPTVVLRAELDAVPVPETLGLPYASATPGVAHKCGHDGHMAILVGVARRLAAAPPRRGRVVLLMQPAEETAAGARAVAADERFGALAPDWLFALHNLPGYPLGQVLVRDGAFSAGSAGLRARLAGRTAHAAHPERGRSPDRALADLIPALVSLPVRWEKQDRLCLVTVTHARLGEPSFGVAPGEAEILATLRADDDQVLDALREQAAALVRDAARRHGLTADLGWEEVFPVTWNHPDAAAVVRRAAAACGCAVERPDESPFRWSEDFGVLARLGRGAMFGLGAGAAQPDLHAQDYDFPEMLLETGGDLMLAIVRELTDA